MPDQPQGQSQQDGGFLGGIMSNPLVMIGGLLLAMFMFFPNLISGIFGAIGSMISGMMGGNKEQESGQGASNMFGGLFKMFGMGGEQKTQETAQTPVAKPVVNMSQPTPQPATNAVLNGVEKTANYPVKEAAGVVAQTGGSKTPETAFGKS